MASKRACINETKTTKNDHGIDRTGISWNKLHYARACTERMTGNIERRVRGVIADDRVNGFTKTDVPKKMIHRMTKSTSP